MSTKAVLIGCLSIAFAVGLQGCADNSGLAPSTSASESNYQKSFDPKDRIIQDTAMMNPNAYPGVRIIRTAMKLVPLLEVPGAPGRFYSLDGTIIGDGLAANNELNPETATYTSPPCSSAGQSFVGNTPPVCTNTGAFRRVYSASATAGLAYGGIFPQSNTTMPTGASPLDGTTGFIYAQTWSKPYGTNSEAGFQYSPTNSWYTFYAKAQGAGEAQSFYEDSNEHPPQGSGQSPEGYSLTLESFSYGSPSYPTADASKQCSQVGCVIVVYSTSCPKSPTSICTSDEVLADANYANNSGNCCVAATMTTIGENANTNAFATGFSFGANQITSAETAHYANGGFSNDGTWARGGTQSWPNDSSRIVVALKHGTGTSAVNENDTVNLHK